MGVLALPALARALLPFLLPTAAGGAADMGRRELWG